MNLILLHVPSVIFLLITFCGFLSLNPLYANEINFTNNQLRISVIHNEEPPFLYSLDKIKYKGILPDLAQALSRELGTELIYLPTPRKRLEQSILDAQADIAWMPQEWSLNKQKLIFSEPVFTHRDFLFSLTPFDNDNGPESWLKGKTVCVRQDYQYPKLEQFFVNGTATAIRVSNQVPLLTLLEKGRCELLFMNEHRADWMISTLGIKIKIWRTPQPLEETKLTFMLNRNSKDKLIQINQAIAKIRDSGELTAILGANIHRAILSESAHD